MNPNALITAGNGCFHQQPSKTPIQAARIMRSNKPTKEGIAAKPLLKGLPSRHTSRQSLATHICMLVENCGNATQRGLNPTTNARVECHPNNAGRSKIEASCQFVSVVTRTSTYEGCRVYVAVASVVETHKKTGSTSSIARMSGVLITDNTANESNNNPRGGNTIVEIPALSWTR